MAKFILCKDLGSLICDNPLTSVYTLASAIFSFGFGNHFQSYSDGLMIFGALMILMVCGLGLGISRDVTTNDY